MTRPFRSMIGLGLLLASTAASAPPPDGSVLRMGGNGSALGTLRALAAAEVGEDPALAAVIVPSLGTGGGLRALLGGALDLAASARPLRGDEAGRGLEARFLGETPFVFAVSARSPVTAVSLERVSRIYSGDELAWPDGTPIRLILRPPSDSDTRLLETISPALRDAVRAAQRRKGLVTATTDQDAADLMERLPGAFGMSTLALIRTEGRHLRPLAVDGAGPGGDPASAGYPWRRPLHLVYQSPPSPRVQRFLDFVDSPRGRAIVRESGYLPPTAER